jgi:hypothetical protein
MDEMSARQRVEEQTRIRRALLRNGYVPLQGRSRVPEVGARKFWVDDAGVAHLETTRGIHTRVDYDDLPFALCFFWYASRRGAAHYVARNPLKSLGESTAVYLHRALLAAPSDSVVDHIDGNPLNNCRINLRLASQRMNSWNSRRHFDGASGYKGVHKYGRRGQWIAEICLSGVKRRIGVFDDPAAAHLAYLAEAEKSQGAYFPAHILRQQK